MRTKQYVMNADFKVDIVRLMQHPIMKKPLGDLSESELCCAHDILRRLIDSSGDESFTLVDVLQISRLYYAWGELSYVMVKTLKRQSGISAPPCVFCRKAVLTLVWLNGLSW